MRLHLLPVMAALLAPPALASEPAAGNGAARLSIELNALEEQDGACRLIFVAENETGADLSALVLEAVLFDGEGRVAALTLLDFRDLPAGRVRVRPFDMAGIDCGALERVLINDVAACEAEDGTEADCGAALAVRSRVDVGLLQ
jgi:hypothetical protein